MLYYGSKANGWVFARNSTRKWHLKAAASRHSERSLRNVECEFDVDLSTILTRGILASDIRRQEEFKRDEKDDLVPMRANKPKKFMFVLFINHGNHRH